MNGQISGGCLCGKVRFSVDNSFERLYLCHCAQCRKITGSAFAANLYTPPEQLQWTAGEKYIKRFEFPGRDFAKAFCTECGSGLPYLNQKGAAIIIPAGSLDAEPNIDEQANIFWAERPRWSTSAVDAKYYLQFPDGE